MTHECQEILEMMLDLEKAKTAIDDVAERISAHLKNKDTFEVPVYKSTARNLSDELQTILSEMRAIVTRMSEILDNPM